MGLLSAVDVTSAVVVWPPGIEPLRPEPYRGKGRPPVVPRRTAELQPMSVKALALSLPTQAFQTISWRHHASLSIATYALLMAERLIADKPVGGKKTSPNAKCLPFPRISSPGAVLRAQRHLPHSITALRHQRSYALLARLGQCPCCGRASKELLL